MFHRFEWPKTCFHPLFLMPKNKLLRKHAKVWFMKTLIGKIFFIFLISRVDQGCPVERQKYY